MKKISWLFFLGVSFLLFSCLKAQTKIPTECDSLIVSYSMDIVPIINSSCITGQGPGTGCHDAWIHEYSAIVGYINNGKFYAEIFVDRTMPEIPNIWGIDSLNAAEYEAIKCWLEQGFPEN